MYLLCLLDGWMRGSVRSAGTGGNVPARTRDCLERLHGTIEQAADNRALFDISARCVVLIGELLSEEERPPNGPARERACGQAMPRLLGMSFTSRSGGPIEDGSLPAIRDELGAGQPMAGRFDREWNMRLIEEPRT